MMMINTHGIDFSDQEAKNIAQTSSNDQKHNSQ